MAGTTVHSTSARTGFGPTAPWRSQRCRCRTMLAITRIWAMTAAAAAVQKKSVFKGE